MTPTKITGVTVLEKNGFIQMQVRTPDTRKGYYVEASVPKEHGAESISALLERARDFARVHRVEMETLL